MQAYLYLLKLSLIGNDIILEVNETEDKENLSLVVFYL